MPIKLISRLSYALLLLVAIVLCFKSLREPDLWWMYRTGEWMLENGRVTYQDPFSFTHEGVDWINVKWLFEVIISLFKGIGGPEMIFVLQAGVAVGIILLWTKTNQRLSSFLGDTSETRQRNILVFTALLALFSIDFRLIGRPEMSSHLLSAAFLYLFVHQHQNPRSKLIFWLIPLQLLWTNLHEAFGTGMVFIIGFLGATWLEYYYRNNIRKEQGLEKPLILSWASLAALAAVVINPRGPQMWLHPFNIFGQLEENQFTTELSSYKNASYWAKEAYLNIFFLITASVVVLRYGLLVKVKTKEIELNTKKKTAQKQAIAPAPMPLLQRFGLGYLLLGAMLFYLSLTAYRNIPFFIIYATPLVALGIERLSAWVGQKYKVLNRPAALILPLFLLLFYVGVVSGIYHKWSGSRDEFGLQVLNSHNPIGAADFLKEKGVKGYCYSDFLVSAYLLWKLQPEFKTYIDLRDLDIFPVSFFERSMLTLQDPKAFEEEDKKYNFGYVVLLRRQVEQIPMLFQHLHNSPHYSLVFADAVAVVYLKHNEDNNPIIEQEALSAKHDIFRRLAVSNSSPLPALLNKILNPFFRNQSYENVSESAIAAHFYNAINEFEHAMHYARLAADESPDSWKGWELQGLIQARRYLDPQTPAEEKTALYQNAMNAFDTALKDKRDAVESLFGKAVLLMEQERFAEALPLLQGAKQLDPQNPNIQQHLSVCFQRLGK